MTVKITVHVGYVPVLRHNQSLTQTQHQEQMEFFDQTYDAAEVTFQATHSKKRDRVESMLEVIVEDRYLMASPDKIGELLGQGKVIVIVGCDEPDETFSLEQLSRVHSLDKVVSVQGE